jgi:tetratricopeptide (TPR) repeat protein
VANGSGVYSGYEEMNRFFRAGLIFVAVLSAACTAVRDNNGIVVDDRSTSAPGADSSTRDAPSVNRAVLALLGQARVRQQQGSLPQAIAIMERALRIDPGNALVWHRMASIRLQQKRYRLAESLALKSNTYAGSNDSLRARNWRLVANARYALGNWAGADRALGMARKLDNRAKQRREQP